MRKARILVAAIVLGAAGAVQAQDATFSVRVLTPETALKPAQAALARSGRSTRASP